MPANRAGFALVVAGIDYAAVIVPRLSALSLNEKLSGEADTLEIALSNHDGQLATIKRGVYASLSLGWKQGGEVTAGLVDKGTFLVDEVSKEGPPDVLRIRAHSADLTGDYRRRRDKGWKETTLGALLKKIAGDNGLSAKVDPSFAGIELKQVEQAAKSDMAFVRDLGARYDAVATVKNKTLIFLPIGAQSNAGGQAVASSTLKRQDNSRYRFIVPDRDDHDGAHAQWHDRKGAKRKTVKQGGAKNPKRIKRTFASEGEATAAAAAELRKAKRGTYEFEYEMALGDPAIEPNGRVTLQGWDSEIDGVKWLVDEATHTLDANAGLTSTIKLISVES